MIYGTLISSCAASGGVLRAPIYGAALALGPIDIKLGALSYWNLTSQPLVGLGLRSELSNCRRFLFLAGWLEGKHRNKCMSTFSMVSKGPNPTIPLS